MQMGFRPTPEKIIFNYLQFFGNVLFTCQGNLTGHAKLMRWMKEVLFEMQNILVESLWV